MNTAKLLERAHDHYRAGRLEDAHALCDQILARKPNDIDALNLAATIALQRGDDTLALDLFGRVARLADRRAEAHFNLGLVLLRLAKPEEAEVRLRRTVALAPTFAPARRRLGMLCQQTGRLEDAQAHFRQALQCDPTSDVVGQLADVLLDLGRPAEAIPVLEDALKRSPGAAELHRALGDAWQLLQQLPRAAAAYEQALMAAPTLSTAWWGLGCVDTARKEYARAAESFQRLLQMTPDHGPAWHNLGQALFELGQTDPALDAFQKAASLLQDPTLPLGMIATIIPGSPRADQRTILDARRQWATRCAPSAPVREFARSSADRPLRIGYVSANFKDPNWMKPVWGLVNHHDRDRFEIHLFSDAPASAIQHSYCNDPRDRFHAIGELTNHELARRIEEQAIDILVDLNAYSRLPRLEMFALRPAPVLVAWFNMYATSGMDCFDYLIGDRNVFAVGEDEFYGERVVCVPGSYLTFEVTYPVPDVSAAPCLTRGHFTFGCLAPQYKITSEVVEAWARILQGSPGSRLILKNTSLGSAANRRWAADLFLRFGVPPDRVRLEGPAPHFEFLKTYAEIDLALDTFPYNGGTTTMEALWQGVPVLTFHGDRWASRISASLLRSAGLHEFVAPNLDAYVVRAIELAGCGDAWNARRQTMRAYLAETPACATGSFARDMEAEYVRMWQAWCANR